MGHQWGIQVKILVEQGNLISILLCHPFAIDAENHLGICMAHLVGNKAWVGPRA